MTDASAPKAFGPQLAMAVLVPEAEEADGAEPRPRATSFGQVLMDPFQLLAASGTAWVDLRFSPMGEAIRLDLPYKDPDDLYELLETLYVLHGWKGVDTVLESVERALLAKAMALHPLPPEGMSRVLSRGSSSIHYVLTPADPFKALGLLTALVLASKTKPRVVEALKTVVPSRDIFSQDLPRAQTKSEAELDPEIGVRLFANVLLALQETRSELVVRVRGVLRRTEREIFRLISATLLQAKAEIVRETARYFTLQEENAEIALERLKDLNVSSDGNPAQGGKVPVAKNPKELQEVLKELIPFAHDVVVLDDSPRGTPSSANMIEGLLRKARAVYAREVGRRAQSFPILSQVDERSVRRASRAGAAGLGDVLFPILTRAHKANQSMRARTAEFVGVGDLTSGVRHPEQRLADLVDKAGEGNSPWCFRKYVERAAARVTGEGDEVAHRVLSGVTEAMDAGEGKTLEVLGQSAGEMLVLGTAAHFAKKFVPVLNVATAAWHIATAVKDFGARHDEFYCALDPRDSLVEAAPSAAGLVLDIATEAVFAFV